MHAGGLPVPGVGGSSAANPKWPFTPPPKKRELAIRGDLLLLKRPQKFLEQRVSGEVEVGGVGQHVGMLFVGGPLSEEGPLHVLAGGGGPWWRAVRTVTTLGTRLNAKAVPAKWLKFLSENGRNKKS